MPKQPITPGKARRMLGTAAEHAVNRVG
jgi:hypothetical protein